MEPRAPKYLAFQLNSANPPLPWVFELEFLYMGLAVQELSTWTS